MYPCHSLTGVSFRSLLLLKFGTRLLRGNFHRNGKFLTTTFGDVYAKYKTLHLPTLGESTRAKIEGRFERSLKKLSMLPMTDFDPEKVGRFIIDLKRSYIRGPRSKRYSFEKELRDLKTILQWWIDQYDFSFKNPVKPYHWALSVIEAIPEKEKRVSLEEIQKFFIALGKHTLYQDLAIVQFYCGGRIGEIAGLQIKNIDLNAKKIRIREVLVWIDGNPKVKTCPKNGRTREVFLNDTVLEILRRRISNLPTPCDFVFHNRGKPLRYNRINVAFNTAWKTAGFGDRFSGSHLMRYGSAQAARLLSGSLDGAAAITGHESLRMAAHYGKLDPLPLNRECGRMIEDYLRTVSAAA